MRRWNVQVQYRHRHLIFSSLGAPQSEIGRHVLPWKAVKFEVTRRAVREFSREPLYSRIASTDRPNVERTGAAVYFRNRTEAGQVLADRLQNYKNQTDVLVLGL